MKWRKLSGESEATYALVFDTGDEVKGELVRFARASFVSTARFSGIGALSDVVLGYFDPAERRYRPIPIDEQVEVVSLFGDVTLEADDPKVHAHLVVSDANGLARGGHLLTAHVRPTLEIILIESPSHLRRHFDAASGLALIDVNDAGE